MQRGASIGAIAAVIGIALLALAACRPSAPPENSPSGETPGPTPLPTRQTTIDPVTTKLDAAQRDTDRRRSEIDKAGQ